jgi:hypothetical protein
MAIESIQVSLKAWQRSGKHVPAAAFVDKVAISPDDPVSKHKGPGHARVDLVSKTLFDFEDTAEPSVAFASHHSERMQEFVRWLAKQQASLFESLRQTSCVTEVSLFVVTDASEDAVDLAVSPEFMAECARLGLALAITVSRP